jgi:hypothetical protein
VRKIPNPVSHIFKSKFQIQNRKSLPSKALQNMQGGKIEKEKKGLLYLSH